MRLGKKLVTLGMVACLSVASSMMAFAGNCGATVYGQQPTEYADGWYFAIIAGDTEIQESDINLSSGATISNIYGAWGELPDLTQVNGQWAVPDTWNNMEDGTYKRTQIEIKLDVNTRHYIDLVKLPSNVSAADLGDYAKYIINVNGSTTSPVATGKWVENGTGWWYDNGDGTYPTNTWKVINNVYYYFGADGYLLVNTTTPDGYQVDANGAWIENGNTDNTIDFYDYWLKQTKYLSEHKDDYKNSLENESDSIQNWKADFDSKWKEAYENASYEAGKLNPNTLGLVEYSFTITTPSEITDEMINSESGLCARRCTGRNYYFNYICSRDGDTLTIRAASSTYQIPEDIFN